MSAELRFELLAVAPWEEIKRRRAIGYDCETYPFAPGRQAPRMVCASFFEARGEPIVELAPEARERIRVLLRDCVELDLEIVGLNLAFDLAVLCADDPTFFPLVFGALDAGRIYDVGVYERLRAISLGRLRSDPELRGAPPSFSLSELELKYLGRDRSSQKKGPDVWRTRYGELDGIPVSDWPREAVSYCEDDAIGPVEIRAIQLTFGALPLFRESVRHDFAFFLMKARGIRTHGPTVEALEARLAAIVAEATPRLVAGGILRGAGPKAGSEITTETKRRVLAVLGSEAPLTKTGKAKLAELGELTPDQRLKYTSTKGEVLDLCEGEDEVLDLWASVKADRKELSDFVPKLKLGVDWPINARINLSVSSFRSSMSGPNLQQQPRRSGVRECFVPRPGFLFVSVDYHVAELCSLAQVLLDLFGFSAMAEELKAGRDLHLVFAAELAECPYEEAVARSAAKDPRIKQLRQAAKVANFGIPGGLGSVKLQAFAKGYGVDLTAQEAKDLKDRWLDRFPEMRRYFAWVAQQCAGGSYTHIHPRTGFIRGDVGYCDGANQGFQHLTAAGHRDAVYHAVRAAYSEPDSPFFGSYPLIPIHDEILAEVPEDRAHEAAFELSAITVAAMRPYTPDIEPRADPALMRRWLKDASDVYDADGRLVPWEPCKA